jgi:hypothetical protein
MHKKNAKAREQILELLAKERHDLEARFKVKKLALFGSYARGEQRPDSDVDILVEVDPSIGLDFVLLAQRIEELLGRHVELVSRRAIKPRNWKIIQRELVYV